MTATDVFALGSPGVQPMRRMAESAPAPWRERRRVPAFVPGVGHRRVMPSAAADAGAKPRSIASPTHGAGPSLPLAPPRDFQPEDERLAASGSQARGRWLPRRHPESCTVAPEGERRPSRPAARLQAAQRRDAPMQADGAPGMGRRARFHRPGPP